MTNETIGPDFDDMRLQYLLANLATAIAVGLPKDKNGKSRMWRPSDFVLPWASLRRQLPSSRTSGQEPGRQYTKDGELILTPEETRREVAMIFAMFGGIDPKYANEFTEIGEGGNSADSPDFNIFAPQRLGG